MARVTRVLLAVMSLLAVMIVQNITANPTSALPQSFSDTTTADFDSGNTADAIAQSDTGDGSLALAPGSANFNGTTLPDGWTFTGSGAESVNGGQLHVDGGHVDSPLRWGPGQFFTFTADFTEVGQFVGLTQDGPSGARMGVESMLNSQGQLSIGYVDGGNGTSPYPLGNSTRYVNSTQTFHFQWTYELTTMWIDSFSTSPILKTFNYNAGNMAMEVSDNSSDGNSLVVDNVSTKRLPDASSDCSSMPAWDMGINDPAPTFSNGVMSFTASQMQSQATYSAGSTIDIVAVLPPGAELGWNGNESGYAYFSISRTTPYTLTANTSDWHINNTSSNVTKTFPSFDPTTGQHEYKVDYNANSVTFTVVDQPSLAPITISAPTSAPVNFRDPVAGWLNSHPGGGTISVDNISITHPAYDNNASFASPPTNWSSQTLNTGGTVTASNGQLVVDDSQTGTNESYAAGHTLDFWSSISGAANQSIGWGQTLASGQPLATLTTGSAGGQLLADGDGTTSALPSSLLGALHHYQIAWSTSSYTFSVLDVSGIAPVTLSSTLTSARNMHPVVSDSNTSADSVKVGSLQVLPISGDSTSRIFDAGQRVPWTSVTYALNVPTNTSAQIAVRAGDTPTPDSSWSPWATVANSGDNPNLTGRYAQYRATAATSDDFTMPSVQSVTLTTGSAMPATHFTDTTNADFGAGVRNNTSVVNIGDGAVALTGGYQMPSNGTVPDPSWRFNDPSAVSMSNGAMYINGTYGIQSGVSFEAPSVLTFTATMSGNEEQQVGFEQDNTPPGFFSAGAWFDFEPFDGQMYIKTSDETPMSEGWKGKLGGISLAQIPGQTHNFEIFYNTSNAIFYADGTYIGSLVLGPTSLPMHLFAYDAADTVPLVISGENVSQPTSGTFTSRILGDGNSVISGPVTWNAALPGGTGITVEVHTGNTPLPDATWSSYETVANGSSPAYGGKYAQYQVTFTTSTSNIPDLQDLTLTAY